MKQNKKRLCKGVHRGVESHRPTVQSGVHRGRQTVENGVEYTVKQQKAPFYTENAGFFRLDPTVQKGGGKRLPIKVRFKLSDKLCTAIRWCITLAGVDVGVSRFSLAGALLGATVLTGMTVWAVQSNPVWWNYQCCNQGEAVNRSINGLYYGGDYAALNAWASGGHERCALTVRQARTDDGSEAIVTEARLEALGKPCYLQGYNDRHGEYTAAVDKLISERDAEFKRRDNLTDDAINLARQVVSADFLPDDKTEQMSEYIRALVKRVEECRSENSDGEDWYYRYRSVCDKYSDIKKKYAELVFEHDQLLAGIPSDEEAQTDDPPDNVLRLVPEPELETTEATPEQCYRAHELEGLSWQEIADRYNLKGRQRARYLAGLFTPGMEVAQNG